jgi:hypothetical protein
MRYHGEIALMANDLSRSHDAKDRFEAGQLLGVSTVSIWSETRWS